MLVLQGVLIFLSGEYVESLAKRRLELIFKRMFQEIEYLSFAKYILAGKFCLDSLDN